MRTSIIIVLMAFLYSSMANAENGLIAMKSVFGVTETVERLEKVLERNGMKIFAIINHAEGAKKVGKSLRPTELVIFGNPKIGTLLMQCGQSVAIDLPQKALVWEDEKGYVWFSYNDPSYLSTRHAISDCNEIVKKISVALESFARAATSE